MPGVFFSMYGSDELYNTMQQFMKFHLGLIPHLCDAGADLDAAEMTLR